jgi:hypothetical protein
VTEQEWLTATEPMKMLKYIRQNVSDRKLRLFGVACCRRIWSHLHYEIEKLGVLVAEKYADGLMTEEEMRQVNSEIDKCGDTRNSASDYVTHHDIDVVCQVSTAVTWCGEYQALCDEHGNETQAATRWKDCETREQLVLLRDIFGNPFHPVTADPSWLTPTVTALASAIYTDRAFDRLPILADALEEAGCDHPDVLAHCRGDGPHARGCWVVDLVLGKT